MLPKHICDEELMSYDAPKVVPVGDQIGNAQEQVDLSYFHPYGSAVTLELMRMLSTIENALTMEMLAL
jgi:hypothetical protein